MRTVQTILDAEQNISKLWDELARIRKEVLDLGGFSKKEKSDEVTPGLFFDIANEVEFIRDLNLVIHKLAHKFPRIDVRGESRWYDFAGRTPSQWFTQFALIDGPNKSLFLRDELNQPIWEIIRRISGSDVSRWMIYADLLPPSTNPITPQGFFDIGGGNFRWDDIFARKLDLDMPTNYGTQLKVTASGSNVIGLTSYDADVCALTLGTDFLGGTWTARSSSAWVILKESSGDLIFFGNKSLTAGNSYSPTPMWRFQSSGALIPKIDASIGDVNNHLHALFGNYGDFNPTVGTDNQITARVNSQETVGLISFGSSVIAGAITFGAEYHSQWIAKSSSAVILLKGSDSAFSIYKNTGLTTGSPFTPTLTWQFDGSGHFIPGTSKDIGNSSNRVRTIYATNMDVSTFNPNTLRANTVGADSQLIASVSDANYVSLSAIDSNSNAITLGAEYTTGWIARASSAVTLLKTSGELWLYQNSGLFSGGAYSPTNTWKWDSSGHFYPAAGQNVGNPSFRVGTVYAQTLNVSDLNTTRTNLGVARNGSFTTNTGGADGHSHTIVLTSI